MTHTNILVSPNKASFRTVVSISVCILCLSVASTPVLANSAMGSTENNAKIIFDDGKNIELPIPADAAPEDAAQPVALPDTNSLTTEQPNIAPNAEMPAPQAAGAITDTTPRLVWVEGPKGKPVEIDRAAIAKEAAEKAKKAKALAAKRAAKKAEQAAKAEEARKAAELKKAEEEKKADIAPVPPVEAPVPAAVLTPAIEAPVTAPAITTPPAPVAETAPAIPTAPAPAAETAPAIPTAPAPAAVTAPAIPTPPAPAAVTAPTAETTPAIPVPAIALPTETPAVAAVTKAVADAVAPAIATEQGNPTLTIAFKSTETTVPLSVSDELNKLAKQMIQNENQRLNLIAYAAASGDQASTARRVSLSRALSVRAFLIDAGVANLRINVQAEGDKNAGGNPDRVDLFIVSAGDQSKP
jgi:outer membrane protein OmpA-like peptidoglycan-associated protein